MKYLKTTKLIFFITVFCLVLSIFAFAEDINLRNTDKAEILKNLGLFNGTNKGFELERVPNRVEGSVMLIRLLGKENEVKNNSYEHPFTDVPEWADRYVGYMYKNGLTLGVGNNQFGSEQPLNSKAYTTFVLRTLGYDDKIGDFTYDKSLEMAEKINLFGEEEKELLQSCEFKRDEMVGLSYLALKANIKDSSIKLINKLVNDGAVNEDVVNDIIDKNIYTQEFLQDLVDKTECDESILDFRSKSNDRRKGLLKIEGKYFDMYYPNDKQGKGVASFLSPHMDKVYMMLSDIYGVQAEVEVHLIHEEDTKGLMEGKIREKEKVTFIWLEEDNDEGGNNLSEFVHEINHNFFSKVNNGASNEMWINEANAKLIPSLYIKDAYDGTVEMWSFYEIKSLKRNMKEYTEEREKFMSLKEASNYLSKAKSWGKSDGDKKVAQRTGLYFWSYIYNKSDLDTFKYYLRNMGTSDVISKMEELLNKSESEITEELFESIN